MHVFALKNYFKIADKVLSRSVMHDFFYSDKDKVKIPYITLGSKDLHFVIFEIKSLNIKKSLVPTNLSFSKCEIQRYILKGGCPDGELLIRIDQFPVPKLEFTVQQFPCEAAISD